MFTIATHMESLSENPPLHPHLKGTHTWEALITSLGLPLSRLSKLPGTMDMLSVGGLDWNGDQ